MTRIGQMGEGERLHAQRRRRFWIILGSLALLGAIAGFASGFIAGFNDARTGTTSSYMTVGTIGIVLLALGAAYGSWRFFVNVDEVEVADNLWGSLIGFYTYAILFPAWWALHRIGQTAEPNDWWIFGISMLVACAVYFYRKLRYR